MGIVYVSAIFSEHSSAAFSWDLHIPERAVAITLLCCPDEDLSA